MWSAAWMHRHRRTPAWSLPRVKEEAVFLISPHFISFTLYKNNCVLDIIGYLFSCFYFKLSIHFMKALQYADLFLNLFLFKISLHWVNSHQAYIIHYQKCPFYWINNIQIIRFQVLCERWERTIKAHAGIFHRTASQHISQISIGDIQEEPVNLCCEISYTQRHANPSRCLLMYHVQ